MNFIKRRLHAAGLLFAFASCLALASSTVQAQQPPGQSPPAGAGPTANPPAGGDLEEADQRFNEAINSPTTPPSGNVMSTANKDPNDYMPSLLQLFFLGGWFMVPIAAMSLVAIIFSIERMLAIRKSKLMPSDLVGFLGEASQADGGLDPRKVYKACQQFPSSAANVIRSAMLKVGRPHSEVEQTVKDALDREAEKVFKNLRPIILASTVSPLLGLLGTVWGLVDCFARMASGVVVGNKAEQLSSGIYIALMTTVFGLCVAIPGSMITHWLEGRIQSIFREIEELMLNIMPQMERFEGKLRVQRKSEHSSDRSSDRPGPATERTPADRHSDERGKPQVAVD